MKYIPHQAVTNVNKPSKIRVVFDAGARYKNTSLNKNLPKGPVIVPRRDNLNRKVCRVNIFLKKFCMENDFAYTDHGNIKPRQHCNYS